jgi:hypothetical protein
MSATLEIRDTPQDLSIRVSEPRSYGRLVPIVLVGAFAIYFFLHASSSRAFQLFGLIFAFGLAKEIISSLRGTSVQLRVGNLDLVSSGHAPAGYGPSTISRADIYSFEYRKASGGGGETPEYPQGLYADYRGGGRWQSGRCILPHINQVQAEEVIEAIYKRFPDMGTLAPGDPFESDLISLNLNQPAKR